MSRHASKIIFTTCEKLARNIIPFYRRYRNIILSYGNDAHLKPELSRKDNFFIVLSILCCFGLFFIMQAEFYQGRNLLQPVMPDRWLAVVIVFMFCGFLSSYALGEIIPSTRVVTVDEESPQLESSSRIDRLVDQVHGVVHKQRITGAILARRYGLGFIGICLIFISGVTTWGASINGNWLHALLPPFFFVLDCAAGIFPVWLFNFIVNRISLRYVRYLADRALNTLEIEWNKIPELYHEATQRFMEEQPEQQRGLAQIPPVSPLVAFLVQNYCKENIIIPDNILSPSQNVNKEIQPRENKPPVKPAANNNEDSTEKTEEPGSTENPADLFSAMDSESDANDVTF